MYKEWYVDGGGDGSKLSMDSIINKTCPVNEYVLYAEFIDKGPAISALEDFQTALGADTDSDTLVSDIADVDTLLGKTSSNRFYLGEEAQLNITRMKDLSTTVSDLRDKAASLDPVSIGGDIDTYNNNLRELKKDARRTLLENKVAELNARNEEYFGWPKTVFFKFKNGWEVNGRDTYWEHDYNRIQNKNKDSNIEKVKVDVYDRKTWIEDKREQGGEYAEYCQYYAKFHHYKHIEYSTGLFKSIKFFWDSSFEEVEQRIIDAWGAEELPYDPAKITKETDDLDGWNKM